MNTATAMTTSWLRRYRSLVVVAVVASIIVLKPGDSPDATTTGSANNGGFVTPGPGAVSPNGQPNASGAAVPGATAAGGTAPGGSAPGGSAGASAPGTPGAGAGGQPGAANIAAYPGIGTPAALSNPNCDPERGRIKLPTNDAPPCVAPWPEGADNGGSTAPGVTADTIKAVWVWQDDNDEERDKLTQDYVNLYNKHLELWGRKVELVIYYSGAIADDEAACRAAGSEIANTHKPFLVFTSVSCLGVELARRRIIVQSSATFDDSQALAPYLWGFPMDDRSTAETIAEWIGKRLQGLPAKWAGDAAMRTKPRVFGLLYQTPGWSEKYWDESAAAHGVEVAVAESYSSDPVQVQERMRIIMAKFKNAGVTSIINGSDLQSQIIATNEATRQLFFPEWVQTGWLFQDLATFARLADQQQMAHAFGLGSIGTPVQESSQSLYEWQYGRSAPASQTLNNPQLQVGLGVMLPCIQLAGPTLTPDSFRDGCFNLHSGGFFCGCKTSSAVSFGRWTSPWDDYSGLDDYSEKWWDANYTGPDEVGVQGRGIFMRVDGGARYVIGKWPTGEPKMFDPAGAVSSYDKYPPGEEPPTYENTNPG